MSEKPNMLHVIKRRVADAEQAMNDASAVIDKAMARIKTLGDEASELRVRVGILEVRSDDAIAALHEMIDGGSENAGEDTRIGAVIRTLEGEKP